MTEMAAGKLERHHNVMVPPPPDMPCRESRMFTLGRTENRGRQDTELIICPSDFVSRQHCDIFYKNGAFWIKDLKSLNGTFLNGQKIVQLVERELRFGDIVGLGVSHQAADVDTRDPLYYIFTFKAQQFEIIDLDSEDEAVSKLVPIPDTRQPDAVPKLDDQPTVSSVANNSVASDDEDIEIVEEKLSSSPSSPTKLPPKPRNLPPPPPPPIISKPHQLESRNVRIQSIENLASSSSSCTNVSVQGHSASSPNRSIVDNQRVYSEKPFIPKPKSVSPYHDQTLNSSSLNNKYESTGSFEQAKSPQKAGPASFKRKIEAKQEKLNHNFTAPSLPGPSRTSNESVPSVEVRKFPAFVSRTPVAPSSETSFGTIAKNSSPVDRDTISPLHLQSPHLVPVHRTSTESSSGDDSSDGMSESCSQRHFVPNVESDSSPEHSRLSNDNSSDDENDKIQKKSNVPKSKVITNSTISKRHKKLDEIVSSKSKMPNESRSSPSKKSRAKTSMAKNSHRDRGNTSTTNAQTASNSKKKILPGVRVVLRQLIIRNSVTGELTMRKQKFDHLSSSNRQKIATQFQMSYDRVQNQSKKAKGRSSSTAKTNTSDSSDFMTPVKKKPRIDESSGSDDNEDKRGQNGHSKKSKSSRMIRADSTDSDSQASGHQEPKRKKAKTSNSSLDKRTTAKETIGKTPSKDEKPGCSKNLIINSKPVEKCMSTSPISDRSSYHSDEVQDDAMDIEEDGHNLYDDTATDFTNVIEPEVTKKVQRTAKLIDNPPLPREMARRMGSARRRAQLDEDNRNTKLIKKKSFDSDGKDARTQKLKEVARKEPQRTQDKVTGRVEARPQAPVKVKIPHSRNQDLIDTMLGSEQIQKELERATTLRIEEPRKTNSETPISAPRREIPFPSPNTQSKMPLNKIQKDIDRLKSNEEAKQIDRLKSNEEAKKRMPPPKMQSDVPVHDPRTLMKKYSATVDRSTSSSASTSTVVNYHHRLTSIPAARPGSSNQIAANRVHGGFPIPEDAVYKAILHWRPPWLEEQKTIPTLPPITRGYDPVVRTLYEYKDYKSYVEIFFPLLLLEIWATVTQDFLNKRRARNGSFEKCEFPVAIDVTYPKYECPMLRKSSQKKGQGSKMKPVDKFTWTQVECHGLITKPGEIPSKRDLAILTMKVDVFDEKEKKTIRIEKDYFGFILSSFENNDISLSDKSVIFNQQLRQICPQSKFKHSMTVVIELPNGDKVDPKELGRMKLVSYISAKLRDVKALNYMRYSGLINHIINPGPPKVLFNPNAVISQHQLIPHVSKLNSTQKSVVAHVYDRVWSEESELMLLHGPPGTGKTRTIVSMILQLLLFKEKHHKSREVRILVCTPSNTALDEVMCRLEEAMKDLPRNSDIRMVRLGETDASKMKKYSLDTLANQSRERCSTSEGIRDAITQCDKEIVDKKNEIQELMNAPQHSKTTLESLKRELRDLEIRRDDYKSDFSKRKVDNSSFTAAKKNVLKTSNIIFSTLNSCSNSFLSNTFGYQSGQQKPFLCCIVDEASQTTEPETLAPLLLQVENLILVGDPHQLGATVLSTEAAQKDFGLSMFARLHHYYTRTLKNPGAVMTLTQQYRMHPEILSWPNDYFYKSQLKTHCIGRSSDEDTCILKPYLFLNLSSQESSNQRGQISNDEEVKMVVEIIRTIDLMTKTNNQQPGSIGVITPYSTQKGVIRDALKKELAAVANLVEVDTVDSFQGREKDIIIISCVRTDDTGFLKNPLRLNVALTRAKHSLLMIGDAECLRKDLMWNSLIENAKERRCHYDIDATDKSNPGFLRKRLYKLILSPNKSQIPEEQRKRDWLGT